MALPHGDSLTSFEPMVTITITAEAFASIAGTLVEGSKGDARPDGKGGYLIVLPHAILARLKTMRGPGESYSDVILALAKGGVDSHRRGVSPAIALGSFRSAR
jgi:hypothetical protein